MGGCKAPSLTPTEKFDLPEAFIEDTDTVTMASVSWKEFFPDAYLVEYIDSALSNNHSFLKTIDPAFRRIYYGRCWKQHHQYT